SSKRPTGSTYQGRRRRPRRKQYGKSGSFLHKRKQSAYEDIETAVDAAKKAFRRGSAWRSMDASRRGFLINRLADLVERDAALLSVGVEIYRKAADTMKRLVLELGGKSANIILKDADLDGAVEHAHLASFHNQTTKDQAEIVMRYIEAGQREGARLEAGGKRLERPGYFIEPTIFSNVTDDMTIAKEEGQLHPDDRTCTSIRRLSNVRNRTRRWTTGNSSIYRGEICFHSDQIEKQLT
ncbi:unnamed protein product, partial [Nesidiocoris tenuis]